MPLASTVSGEVLHYPPLKEIICNLNLVTHQRQSHGQDKAIVDLASHQVTFCHLSSSKECMIKGIAL